MSDQNAPDDSPPAKTSRSIRIDEDWAATIIGLALLFLVLAGVIPTEVIP